MESEPHLKPTDVAFLGRKVHDLLLQGVSPSRLQRDVASWLSLYGQEQAELLREVGHVVFLGYRLNRHYERIIESVIHQHRSALPERFSRAKLMWLYGQGLTDSQDTPDKVIRDYVRETCQRMGLSVYDMPLCQPNNFVDFG